MLALHVSAEIVPSESRLPRFCMYEGSCAFRRYFGMYIAKIGTGIFLLTDWVLSAVPGDFLPAAPVVLLRSGCDVTFSSGVLF